MLGLIMFKCAYKILTVVISHLKTFGFLKLCRAVTVLSYAIISLHFVSKTFPHDSSVQRINLHFVDTEE